jgi:hypothetical protein
MTAYFYVSWMIANFVFVVPSSLTTVLHAMSSAQQSSLQHSACVTLVHNQKTCLGMPYGKWPRNAHSFPNRFVDFALGLAFVAGLFANALLQ